MLQQRPRPLNNLPHSTFTYGISLVTTGGRFAVQDTQILEGLDEFGSGISPRILDPPLPKELDEGAVCVVSVLRKEGETILVVSASTKDD